MGYDHGGPVQTALIARPSLWRAGLVSLFKDSGWPHPFVFEAWADFLEDGRAGRVRAVLIDPYLASQGTAADVEELRRVSGGAVVVAFAPTTRLDDVAAVFRKGMDGCVAVDAGIEIVLITVRHVMLGERVFPSSFVEALLDQHWASPTDGAALSNVNPREPGTRGLPAEGRRIDKLTPREREVLQHLTFGRTNKEVARDMGLAEATVKVYIRALCRKLKAKNRTQAVATLHMDQGSPAREKTADG